MRLACKTVTIAAGQSLSPAFTITGTILAFGIPLNFTGSLLTFQSDPNGDGTFGDVTIGGGFDCDLVCAAGVRATPDAERLAALRHLRTGKLRSGSSGVLVPQVQAVDIMVLWLDERNS